jgi:hypothetical protein
MLRNSFAAGVAGGIAGAISLPLAAWAGPAVATEWKTSTLVLGECKKRAVAVMEDAGFGRFENARQSVFGTRGDYTATVRCLVEKGIVIFIVAGPNRREVGRTNDRLSDSF